MPCTIDQAPMACALARALSLVRSAKASFSSTKGVFEKLSNMITKNAENKGISEAEVLAMVSMSEEHGDITSAEKNRIENL